METFLFALPFVVLVLLIITGAPFYVAFSACGIIFFVLTIGMPGKGLGQIAFTSVDSFTLLAIPLFVFLGNIMAVSGATTALFNFARAIMGHVPGGLGMATVVAAAMFGTMCGSGLATALAVGMIAVPELVKSGYRRSTVAAIVGASGPLGLMIPPSLAFIIFGDILGVSVGKLFVAGIVPGIILAVLLCLVCYITGRRNPELVRERGWTWRQRGRALVEALPAAVIPLCILGSIYGGFATPTESAGVACIVAILLGRFYFHKLNLVNFKQVLGDTARTSGVILLVVVGAMIFGTVLSFERIPQSLGLLLAGLEVSTTIFLLIFLGLFILLGMIFDAFILILVCFAPLVPAILAFDLPLIPMAVLTTAVAIIGQVTPPVGITLYGAAAGAGAKASDTFKEVLPYIAALVIGALFIIFIPGLASLY